MIHIQGDLWYCSLLILFVSRIVRLVLAWFIRGYPYVLTVLERRNFFIHLLFAEQYQRPYCRYYIYELSFKDTTDTYIGSTLSLPQRLNNHKNALEKNKHINHLLQKAYNTYKTSIAVKILFSGETKQKSVKLRKEQEYILKYQPSLNLINSYIPSGKVICDCGKQIC